MSVIIPKKLKIFIKAGTQVHRTVSGQKQMVFVKKAFATDFDKPKTHETAERWAKSRRYVDKTKRGFEVVDKDNKPFEGLKIYNIEVRSEGGRAYKVQTTEGWCFDCREDCILDTIMEDGIDAGGRMNGKYVWVKDSSQMKITRVGSELYQEAQKDMAKIKKGKIKNKDLEYGGVYKNRSGVSSLYLGKEDGKLVFGDVYCWTDEGQDWATVWKKKEREQYKDYLKGLKEWEESPPRKLSSWYIGRKEYEGLRESGYKPRDPRVTYLKRQKSHTYTDKVAQLTKEEIKELIICSAW